MKRDYDLAGKVIGAALDEGVLLNFGSESLQFKKKFRKP